VIAVRLMWFLLRSRACVLCLVCLETPKRSFFWVSHPIAHFLAPKCHHPPPDSPIFGFAKPYVQGAAHFQGTLIKSSPDLSDHNLADHSRQVEQARPRLILLMFDSAANLVNTHAAARATATKTITNKSVFFGLFPCSTLVLFSRSLT
jgi:hypothetical protein